ncbi:MAG: hypothetical protein JWM53_1143 [bacterium]|nr:hypothetical protein [bacterium]
MTFRQLSSLVAVVAIGFFLGRALAQTPPPASGPAAKPAALPTNCKMYGPGKCCDPAIAAHLSKDAIYSSCGESDATFLGEQGSKDTCKYFFKVAGAKEEETFVQVYAPAQKEVPEAPNDPFFKWGKIGKVFYTEKALSPKSAPMVANATGLWLPAKGYFVAVNASTKVCDKAQVKRLAAKMK